MMFEEYFSVLWVFNLLEGENVVKLTDSSEMASLKTNGVSELIVSASWYHQPTFIPVFCQFLEL
ncbi:hypothetical protein SAMN05216325_102186 [Nitrosomonas marina]|uniref:Uncharacterized protein n=1 Tax=Nitrosomonas marina TaxID=917 RepID=A0A1H8BAN4_9PROT|nr:hypothetical protein SAMN05216325_102186 [Nitrosomonas marina]